MNVLQRFLRNWQISPLFVVSAVLVVVFPIHNPLTPQRPRLPSHSLSLPC
jgi:hypothetical protein